MSTKWIFEGWVYSDRDGRIVGPVTPEELKQVIATGEVQPADRVWRKWKNQESLLLPDLAREVFNADQPTEPF